MMTMFHRHTATNSMQHAAILGATFLWIGLTWESPAGIAQVNGDQDLRWTTDLEPLFSQNHAIEFEWKLTRECLVSDEVLRKELKFKGTAHELNQTQVVQYQSRHPCVRTHRALTMQTFQSKGPNLQPEASSAEGGTRSPVVAKEGKFVSRTVEQEFAFDDPYCYSGTMDITGIVGQSKHDMLLKCTLQQEIDEDPHGSLAWNEFLYRAGLFFPGTAVEMGKPPTALPLFWLATESGHRLVASRIAAEKEVEVVFEETGGGHRNQLVFRTGRRYMIRSWEVIDQKLQKVLLHRYEGQVAVPGTQFDVPQTIVSEYFRWETNPERVFQRPVVRETLKLIRADVSSSSQVCGLDYRQPGDYIADRTLPESSHFSNGQVQYQVPANPKDLERAIEAARKGQKVTPVRRRWMKLLGITLGLLVAGILCWKGIGMSKNSRVGR